MVLAASETFIVAAYYPVNEPGDKMLTPTLAADPAITIDPPTVLNFGTSLAFPTAMSAGLRASANFTFVPEPSTALLIAPCLVALAKRGRHTGRSGA